MRLISFIIFIWLFCISASYANNNKYYVVGIEDLEYYPLWRYDRELKEYKGIGRKLLDAFAKDKGYIFKYQPYPIKRLVKKLVNDEIDFKFPDNPYWAKDIKSDKKIFYSKPAISYIDGVFVKPENKGRGNESINMLGSVLGFTPWDWLGEIEKGNVKLKETPNFKALINQTISGRIDGAYVNADVVRYHLKIEGREGALIYDEGLSHTEGNYLLSTTKHKDIIEEFNKWMEQNPNIVADLRKEFGI